MTIIVVYAAAAAAVVSQHSYNYAALQRFSTFSL